MLRRQVMAALQPLMATRVYTVRQGLARGHRRRGGLGFVPRLRQKPPEEVFMERLELDGLVVYDVGGDEGLFTLFFARKVGRHGRVITFEPNPRSYARIAENVRLNSYANVTLCDAALGRAPMRASLVFPPDERARGSLRPDIQSQIRQESQSSSIEVRVETLDGMIEKGQPAPDFVKLDVEGLELDVLHGMTTLLATRRPRLYIELHGADPAAKLANTTGVIHLLWRSGYVVHHVESDRDVSAPEQIASVIEGHLYCTPSSAH